MKILTSGRSRRASAARASTSWRERVLAVNSTTPRLMIVRCQPTQGGPSSRRSVTLGRLRIRSPEPPSPPRAGAQSGDDGTQSGCLAGGDPLGGDGIGKGGVQLVDAVTFPVEALSQVCNGRPQLLDGTFEGADGPGADNLVFLPAFPVLTGFVQGGQAPGQHHHCRPAAASASGGPGAARTPAMSPKQRRARHRSCGGRRRRPQG